MSKKVVRAMNKRLIDEVKRKPEFPTTFVYVKLIEIVKKNLKEFFLDPNDLIQNSSGQINRKKGGKKMISQGAYEFGEGYFDLKFDGKIGVRNSFGTKDRKGRAPVSNVNKANHFWWLISKAYLNKFLLEDARNSVSQFLEEVEKESEAFRKEDENDKSKTKVEGLFNSKCINFETLTKNDPDLEGVKEEEIKEEKVFPDYPLLDDNLWTMDDIPEKEVNKKSKDEVAFY